jgi:hypothetical protein
MVDGLAVERVIPPVSSPGRVKGVSPEHGRGKGGGSDSHQGKRPEGEPGGDDVEKGGEDSQGSRIDICV